MHCVCITKTNILMLFIEVDAACFGMKQNINSMCTVQNVFVFQCVVYILIKYVFKDYLGM